MLENMKRLEPSKSPAMEKFLDTISDRMFGTQRTDAIVNATCVSCGKPADNFRDELSAKEFQISGLCQKCQDSVFGS